MPGKGWSTDEAAAAPAHINSIMCMNSPCEKQPHHSLRVFCIPTSDLKRISVLQLMQEILPKDSIPYAENIYFPSWQKRKILRCKLLTGFFSTFPAFAKELFESVLTKIFAGLLFTRQQALHSDNITYFARQISQIFPLQKKTTLGRSFWSNWQPQEGKKMLTTQRYKVSLEDACSRNRN